MLPSVRCRPELKNCAASKLSSKHCRAVDVSSAVRLQIGVGVFAFLLFKAKDHVGRRCGSRDQRQCDHEKWSCVFNANQWIHCFFLPFPLELIFEIAGPEEAKNPAVLRLIQIRFNDAEYAKIVPIVKTIR